VTLLDKSAGVEADAHGEESASRVRQLLALNSAAVAITSELELGPLLQRIVDAARDLVGCRYSALGVLGEDGFIERFPTSGISEQDRERIGHPPRGHGLLGVMLRAGRSLRIPNIGEDPRRIGFPPNHPVMVKLLGVPIFVRGKLVGTLYLTDRLDDREFTEEDEWLVQLLATHAATAITNSQLHAENVAALRGMMRERSRTQALLHVSQAITRSVHLDEVIPQILQSAVDLLEVDAAAVFLVEQDESGEPQGDPKVIAARYSVGLEYMEGRTITLPVATSFAGRAFSTGITQVVQDVASEIAVVTARLTGDRAPGSMVVVQLSVPERRFGALSVYAQQPNAFTAETIELVEAFGAQASVALGNAVLYYEAEIGRRAAELEGARLRELEHMKDEFLSTAAHELRTPLTTIRMSAGLAKEQLEAMVANREADQRLADLVGLVVESSARMQALVNDLLDLTRLEQGRAAITMEELDLRAVARAARQATGPLFESKGQRVSVHLPEVYCGVMGDSPRLEQVAINLLSNAHKYSPPGSMIELRVARAGTECLLSVRDNGPGVPEVEREAIFERFYRSSLHRNDRTASTGLGLPIARTVAELHKGRVWVEEAPGGGAVFWLSLPLASQLDPEELPVIV
jgi:signal transduction histidine kinase